MKKWMLFLISFTQSAVVMILELVGSRLLSPYLGTSALVWTSLIGTILAAISLGYFLGGRIADKYPSFKTLSIILFVASIAIIFTRYAATSVGIAASSLGPFFGPIIAALILFAPATIALAMINPVIVRLLLHDVQHSGRTIGQLYAISNIGSIIGTFLGGFYLISTLGSTQIITWLAIITFIMSSAAWFSKKHFPLTLTVFIIVLVPSFVASKSLPDYFYTKVSFVKDVDTQYGRSWIYDYRDASGRDVRVLTDTSQGAQSAIYKDSTADLVFSYLRMYDIAEVINPNYKQGLVIGGSTYTYPRSVLARYPNKKVDVVEIDPGITKVAELYFGLTEDPRLTIIHQDGRVFLNANNKKYDAIFMDAFLSSLSIPYHLTTQEAAKHMRESLNSNGILLTNVVSAFLPNTEDFIEAEYATYKSVFPYVYALQIEPGHSPTKLQNFMLIASDKEIDFNTKTLSNYKKFLFSQPLISKTILTDNFAPVEKYVINSFIRP